MDAITEALIAIAASVLAITAYGVQQVFNINVKCRVETACLMPLIIAGNRNG